MTDQTSRINRAKVIREEQQCSLQEAVRLERIEFLTAQIHAAETIEDLKPILFYRPREYLMSEKAVTILQQQRAADLAIKLDEGLGLVVAHPEGADIYLGDLIVMGTEISDLLREIGGLASLSRS